MVSKNNDQNQKNQSSLHSKPLSEQKSGKGSVRMAEDDSREKAQLNKKNPQGEHHSGNDPQRFSDKVNDTGRSQKLAKGNKPQDDDED